VLAGGAARRFPEKLELTLTGVVAALAAVVREVVVLAKEGTELPDVAVPVWREPAAPRHPLFGIAWALERAGGRDVLAVAGDMVALDPAILRALAGDPGAAPAVVPRHPGGTEPLCALYGSAATAALRAGAVAGRPARAVVEELGPDWLGVPDASGFANVNRLEDLPNRR
jgi:molybdopterin-guanine dinucleotide biosynthesis protein A